MQERNHCEKTGDISNSESGEIYNRSLTVFVALYGEKERRWRGWN